MMKRMLTLISLIVFTNRPAAADDLRFCEELSVNDPAVCVFEQNKALFLLVPGSASGAQAAVFELRQIDPRDLVSISPVPTPNTASRSDLVSISPVPTPNIGDGGRISISPVPTPNIEAVSPSSYIEISPVPTPNIAGTVR